MGTRLELQSYLENELGSREVYFNPPESIKISYPAIIYSLANLVTTKADDIKYLKKKRYSVTYISRTPDDAFIDCILDLQYCSVNRIYVVDNLYHYVFDLYF